MTGRFSRLWQRTDRPMARPPAVQSALDDALPWPQAAGLAVQHLAIQSIYFVLPALVATAFGASPAEAVNFLCLSMLAVAGFALLQAATRGPIGAGYPCPGIPTTVMFAAYLLAAASGASLADAAGLMVLTGVISLCITPLLPRLNMLLPTEVTGVVVFLTGASLLPVVLELLHFDAAADGVALTGGAVAGASFAAMTLLAITRTRLAPYAVLLGALGGSLVAWGLGLAPAEGGLLDTAPWLALPHPILPRFEAVNPALLLAFALCLIAAKASLTGVLLAYQRVADGDWRRPDPKPLRRGLLAQGLSFILAGALGGMAPAVSSACTGVSIATRSLARRVAVAGAVLLALLALSPKLLAGVLLVPGPAKAAMLLYVAGFMMALGCGIIVTRLLDARRTVVAGAGLTAGLCVLMAPGFFHANLPALASPLALGALVALLGNVVTLPLVARRISFDLALGPGFAEALDDRGQAMGGTWGVRRETLARAQHALMELGDLLIGRGQAALRVAAVHSDDRLHITVRFAGPPLPKPLRNPRARMLDDDPAAFEAFAMALVLRGVDEWRQRAADGGQELVLAFQD